MSKKAKEIHDAFCDYEVNKAKSLRIKTVRKATERKSNGIQTSELQIELQPPLVVLN